jgi:tetratricopeptide (TPR) repeat protein
MNKKLIIFGVIVLIILSAVGFFVYEKYYKKNSVVINNINNVINNITNTVPANITKQYAVTSGDENFKSKFIEYQNKLEEAVKAYKTGGEKPNVDYFVEKARYAKYLGHNDWSKEILTDIFNYYDNSSVGWNNLAKIYEEEKDYIKANEYYQKMIDTFGEKDYWSFYYYVCSNLMMMNDKAKTQECYSKYKSFGGNDSQIEEWLK